MSALLLSILVGGCGNDGNGPAGPTTRIQPGEWAGTTAQGSTIRFTIASDEKVTAITVGYNFGSCSGSQTFSNLNLATAPEVICIPGPCSGSITSYRSFNYSSGSPGGPITSLNGLFVSRNRAEGLLAFRDLPQCGTATGIAWSAESR